MSGISGVSSGPTSISFARPPKNNPQINTESGPQAEEIKKAQNQANAGAALQNNNEVKGGGIPPRNTTPQPRVQSEADAFNMNQTAARVGSSRNQLINNENGVSSQITPKTNATPTAPPRTTGPNSENATPTPPPRTTAPNSGNGETASIANTTPTPPPRTTSKVNSDEKQSSGDTVAETKDAPEKNKLQDEMSPAGREFRKRKLTEAKKRAEGAGLEVKSNKDKDDVKAPSGNTDTVAETKDAPEKNKLQDEMSPAGREFRKSKLTQAKNDANARQELQNSKNEERAAQANSELKQSASVSAATVKQTAIRDAGRQFVAQVNSLNIASSPGAAASSPRANGAKKSDTLTKPDSNDKSATKLTQAEAQKLISKDGEFGAAKTSDRIADSAIALAGDDIETLKEMRAATKEGFAAAEKQVGGKLPGLAHETLNLALKKIDDKIKSLEGSAT